jgi:hypothetical protein
MCDFNRLAGFLISAQALYLGVLVTLGIAIFNSGSFWLAALNIPLMVGIIVASGAATAAASLALNEANKCRATACGAAAVALANWITAFVVNLGILTAALIGAAVAAPIPFAGALVLGTISVWALTIGVGLSAAISGGIAAATSAFNSCQAANNSSSNNTAAAVVGVLGILTALVAIVSVIAGAASGYLPFTPEPCVGNC